MIEIARWEKPILSLERKGYLAGPKFNKSITAAGRAAVEAQEAEHDRQLGKMIETASKIAQAQQEIAHVVEQAAALMAYAALRTAEVRGDSAENALSKWTAIMMEEAKTTIREKSRET